MNTLYCLLFLCFIAIILNGCSATLSNYESSMPEFDMKSFFNGKLSAHGVVQDRSGKVTRRFRADMVGKWQDNQGTLEEDFYYDNGETQRRVWSLTEHENGSYSATADDVTRSASGRGEGFAFNWTYTLAIEVKGKTWNIDFNDWFYQLDDSRLINRAKMTKWGIKVGEVTLLIEKLDQQSVEDKNTY